MTTEPNANPGPAATTAARERLRSLEEQLAEDMAFIQC